MYITMYTKYINKYIVMYTKNNNMYITMYTKFVNIANQLNNWMLICWLAISRLQQTG